MALDVYKEWLGIPEGVRPPDLYTLLRLVKFEDETEKIRKNYTKLNTHIRKFASGQYSVPSQDLLNEMAKAMLCLTDPERKREYDESLGRVFEEESGFLGSQSVGDYLVSKGNLSREQAKEAESFADARGLSMRDAVVQMKLVDVETATKAFAQELRLSFVDLTQMLPDDSVLDKIPRNIVKRNSILPLFIDDDVLLVACVHEPTPELEEELRLRVGVPIRGVIATPLAVNQGIAKYYAQGMREDSPSEEISEKTKKSTKSSKEKPSKTTTRGSSGKSSSDELKKKQTLVTFMVACWGLIILVLLDQLVLNQAISNHPLLMYAGIAIYTGIAVAVWFFRK